VPSVGTCSRRTRQEPLTADEQAAAERARKEAASAERRDVLASNKAWRSAETVRRRWLTEFITRKAAPKGASAFLAVAQARDPEVLADVKGNHYAAELMSLPKPSYGHSADVAKAVESAPSGRVQLMHMVLTLAAYEARTQITDWRRASAATGRYLSYLEQVGYKLSPVEERALGRRTDLGE
jgi:ParB family transcriptional regulator, chromosome partitioning protein